MLGADVATTTLHQWERLWQKWGIFANAENFHRLPADQLHVALYLTSVYNAALAADQTDATVRAAAFAIAFGHTRAGLPNPIQGHLCRLVLDVAHRRLHKPSRKSSPLTASLLRRIFHVTRGNIQERMVFTALALGFAGFLRWSDLERLSLPLSKFTSSHAELFIVFSKTDQISDGAWVPVSRSNTIYCPVANVEALIQEGGMPTGPFIRRTQHTRNGWSLLDKPLSYSRFLVLTREALQRTGMPAAEAATYGTHMMRRGGATAAAEAGVPDRLFQQHGRWKSAGAKDGYVQTSLRARLSVSQSIEA
jgi:hypothetical protein